MSIGDSGSWYQQNLPWMGGSAAEAQQMAYWAQYGSQYGREMGWSAEDLAAQDQRASSASQRAQMMGGMLRAQEEQNPINNAAFVQGYTMQRLNKLEGRVGDLEAKVIG